MIDDTDFTRDELVKVLSEDLNLEPKEVQSWVDTCLENKGYDPSHLTDLEGWEINCGNEVGDNRTQKQLSSR